MGRAKVHKLAGPRRWQLRCCVRGMTLPCGCLAGVYETYDGTSVTVVDAVAASCVSGLHTVNAVIGEPPQDA